MDEDNTVIRKHVRHVTGVPVEVRVEYSNNLSDGITNISHGGLSFIASDKLEAGEVIKVGCPLLKQESSLSGKVAWCKKTAAGYEVGLEFNDPAEVERMKMVEHICQIESFRRQIEETEGRQLSGEQATREWVSRFAGDFSALT